MVDQVPGGWALRRACEVMSTRCYMQLMNHYILPKSHTTLYVNQLEFEYNLKKRMKKITHSCVQ